MYIKANDKGHVGGEGLSSWRVGGCDQKYVPKNISISSFSKKNK